MSIRNYAQNGKSHNKHWCAEVFSVTCAPLLQTIFVLRLL